MVLKEELEEQQSMILGGLKGDEKKKFEMEEIGWLMMTWWIAQYDGRSA